MKIFTVKQLKKAIEDWPEDDPVVLRISEQGECQLTSDLTSIDQYEDGALMLLGEIKNTNVRKVGSS